MTFEALRGSVFFGTEALEMVPTPDAFAFVAFLTGTAVLALRVQLLFEQRPPITKDPHSQNSANIITPICMYAIVINL